MTPHLNRLVETVQMRGHNICLYSELTKIIPTYPQIFSFSWISGFDGILVIQVVAPPYFL